MKAIDAAVTARLQAQRDHAQALELWKAIRAAYEAGGAEGAAAHLARLLDVPGDAAGVRAGRERR